MKTSGGTRFGIGTKLILGLGTLIGISVVVGVLAIVGLLTIQTTSDDLSRQFLPETVLADQIERSTLAAMTEVRGYWLTGDTAYYQSAVERLAEVDEALKEIQELLDRSPRLVELRKTLPQAKAAHVQYGELLAKTKSATESQAAANHAMDAAATVFHEKLGSYLGGQYTSLAAEVRAGARAAVLQPRIQKIQWTNEVLALSDEVRIQNFKTQATRNPALVRGTLANFPQIESRIDSLLRITAARSDADQLSQGLEALEAYRSHVETWLRLETDLAGLTAQRLEAANALSQRAEEISLAGMKASQETAHTNSEIVAGAVVTIVVGLLVSVLLGTLVAFVLIRSITGPLGLVTALSRKVTAGDFSIDRTEVASRDELGLLIESFYNMVEGLKAKAALIESIANGVLVNSIPLASQDDGLGRSLQRMQDGLNEILTQVNVAVEQMASGSDQVSTAAQSLSQGATEQASSLEEISASANEMHSQSKKNAEDAMTANQLAKQASLSAQQGNQQMKDLMDLLGRMTKSSEETKTIVKTIDDIAFQVNLLALNANVEAARAGKYGKGFAVVAEEVRNLAVRSAAAVNETTKMVEESIRNIQDVNATASKTGEQLSGILGNANKVADFLEEIAASSQEQARAMGQINGGLDQIDQVTQSNTAAAEESASASEELSGQAQQLKGMIGRFRLSEEALHKAKARSQGPGEHRRERPPVSASKPPARGKDIILNDDFETF